MEYLIALVGGLLAAFLYERSKRKSGEALLENQETKEKLLEKDKEIAKSEGVLQSEKDKRDSLQKEVDEVKKDVSIKELEDFFNDNTDNKPSK